MSVVLSRTASFSLLAVAALTIMVGCVIVPGLPTIALHLEVENAASWLVTIPSLGVILFGPWAGKLIDRTGAYKALCIGLFSYGLIGMAGFTLRGHLLVFADRLILGGATAIIMASGTGLISEFYLGKARLQMIAKQGMSIELGGVIFLFVGGLLANKGWHWPFMLYLTAWALLTMVLLFVPQPLRAPEQAMSREAADRLSTTIKMDFLTAALSMTVFFTAVVMLPLRLYDLGLDEAQVGYLLSFTSLVAVAAAAIMPAVAGKAGERGALIGAFIFYALAHLLFVYADRLTLMVGGAVLLGAGFGLSIPLVNHMVVDQSHPQHRGRNLAYLSMAIFTGQFMSSFMEFLPAAQSQAFWMAAAVSLIAAGLPLLPHSRQNTKKKS